MLDLKNREVFEHLYSRFAPIFIHKARSMVRHELAEELVHTLFINIWEDRDLEFANEAAFYGWLYRSVHNACINALRRHHNSQHTDFNEESITAETADLSDRFISHELLKEFFRDLNDRELVICLYYVVDEMTHTEISELEGISVSTVRRTLVRVKEVMAAFAAKERDQWTMKAG